MPSLKGDGRDLLAAIHEAGERGKNAIDYEMRKAEESVGEMVAAIPSLPERAADLMERATLACSGRLTFPERGYPYPSHSPGCERAVRNAALEIVTQYSQHRVLLMESAIGTEIPDGEYRVLLFVIPVKP